MSRAGNLSHRITFYALQTVRDSFGASTESWSTATITTRGDVREVGGNSGLSSDEKTYFKNKELTVRYRPNIVETMKVRIDDSLDTYIITYIEIIGRKESLRMTLEKQGDQFNTTLLLAPSNLVATSMSSTSIGLSWTNNVAADSVSIERSTDGSIYTERIRLIADETTYIDTQLSTGVLYFYRIRAFDGANYSAYDAVDAAIPAVLGSMVITNLWAGTAVAYAAIAIKDATTLYVIQG